MILGCGFGRCGTQGLARLLGVSHEGVPILRSERDALIIRPGRIPDDYDYEPLQARGGDVGPYWINHVPDVLACYPDVKFVCLERDHEAILASVLAKLVYEVSDTIQPPLDRPTEVRAEIEEYYGKARRLEGEAFRIFDMDETLNTERGRAEMLDWAGFQDRG